MATIDKLLRDSRDRTWEEVYELTTILNETEDACGWEYWVAPTSRPGYYHVAVYDEDHNFVGEL